MTDTEVQPDTESTPDHNEHPKDIPHHEARKYRKRAQSAEQLAADLKRELDEKSSRLNELEQNVAALERKARIDELLHEAGALDLESARLLAEIAISEMQEPDVDAGVTELKRRKPYLFRQPARNGTSALAQKFDERSSTQEQAAHAAAEASATGSRVDLLRYLRLRRKK